MSQLNQFRFRNLIKEVTTEDTNVVTGDASDNLNLSGDGGLITTTGNSATYTININASSAIPSSFLTDDANSAIPALNVLTVAGGANIGTTSGGSTVTIAVSGTTDHAIQLGNATGSLTSFGLGAATKVLTSAGAGADPTWEAPTVGTVTSVSGGTNITDSGTATDPILDLDDTITLTRVNAATFDTNVAAAGVTLAGTSLIADGTDPNIDINITPQGTGDLLITTGDVSLTSGNLVLPTTSATVGQITINSINALHMYGTDNIFLGDSGNLTVSGSKSIGIGSSALSSLTSSNGNVAIGYDGSKSITNTSEYNVVLGAYAATLQEIDFNYNVAIGYYAMGHGTSSFHSSNNNMKENIAIGSHSLYEMKPYGSTDNWAKGNIAIGRHALKNLTCDGYNIAIGTSPTSPYGAGANTTRGTSNIYIGNFGAVENRTIRIGQQGGGIGQQNKAYIAGIYGITPGGTKNVALIDSNHQLGSVASLGVANGGTGTDTFTDHGVLVGSGTAAFTALAVGGANEALLGAAGADPTWGSVPNATLTNSSVTLSDGNNITVTGSPLSLGGTASFNLTGTTDHAIQLGNAGGSLTSFGLGAATKVLTSAGAAADPTWETPTVGTVTSVSGGTNITNSGTATDPILDLDAAISGTTSITVANGGTLRTGVNAADTLLLQAYDVNGVAYTTFATLTANNDPSMDLNTITTLGTKYIYRADGTDVPVADGGTGVGSISAHALVIGDGTNPINEIAVGTTNQVLLGNTGADPTWGAVDLTTDVTGLLPIANGGTNANTMATTYGVNYFDGAKLVTTAVGTATHVLTSNGVGVAPTFQVTSAAAGVSTVSGGTNISTSGTAADPIVDLDATITLTTVNATTFDTNVAAAAITLTGTTLAADGSDGDININITAKGTGQVIIDDLQLTTALTVPYGGTGASTFPDGGVLVGATAGPIEALAVGTNGQVLVGSSAANPVFATLGSSDSTIGYTTGAGTLTLQCRDATTGVDGVVELTTDAEATAGTDTSRAVTAAALKAKIGAQTSHGLPYGAGTTTAIAWTAEPTHGQFLMGDTGNVPQLGTLTAGTGITITNAAHSVTVASTGTILNNQTGTTYEFVAADVGKFVTFTNAAAITVTVPVNADVAIAIGSQILCYQGGVGQVTFTPEGGVTINSPGADLAIYAQYSTVLLTKILTDTWSLSGDLI